MLEVLCGTSEVEGEEGEKSSGSDQGVLPFETPANRGDPQVARAFAPTVIFLLSIICTCMNAISQ